MDLLSVNPQLLTFYAPYDRSQRRMLILLNPTNRQVLFKVTSNAWDHYHVSPNAGKLEPYCTREVIISLNNFDYCADLDSPHHFCIKSMYEPRDHINGEATVAIFRRVSRSDISSKTIHVRLEPKPISLTNSGSVSLSSLEKVVKERDTQPRPFCPKCPERLEALQEHKNPRGKYFLSKLVILGSLLGAIFTAYMQRQKMQEIILSNFYTENAKA